MPAYSFREALNIAGCQLDGIEKTAGDLRELAYDVACFTDTLQMTAKDRTALKDKLNAISNQAAKLTNVLSFGY